MQVNAPKQGTPFRDDQPGLVGKVYSLFFDAIERAFGNIPVTYQRTQAQLAALAARLAAKDAGLIVSVTDYSHLLEWDGTGWGWAPGDSGSGMLVPFAVAPTGSGWHLCDGSVGVSYLKSDGTLGTLTLPNTASTSAYLKLGPAYSATITAATNPTISTPTISAPTITVNNATLTQANFTVGVVAADTQATHTHTATSSAPTSSTPTATLGGDPVAHFPAPLWFRQ